jgi:phosphonatase-like hydrolase
MAAGCRGKNHMNYDLVIFDIAGTTVFDGDAVGTCLRRALEHVAGLSFSRDEVNAVMGIPKPVAITGLLEKRLGRRPDRGQVEAVHEDFEARMLEHYRSSPDVKEVDGASGVFRQLRGRGLKVALDTGFGRPITDAVLARLGWTVPGAVDATVTADDVASGRPAPDMVFRAMQLTGVNDAARVVKVGDTPSDLHEGTNAGCGMVVGVTSGSHTAAELLPHPHTILVNSVRDLLETLSI